MKAYLFGLILMFAGAGHAAAQHDISDSVETYRHTAKAPAMAVMVISAEEGIIAQGVSGVRVKGKSAPATLDDKWHLGSNTKAITALVFAEYVERGELRWDMTIPEALPALADDMDPVWTDISVADLFKHKAGLGATNVFWRINRYDDTRSMVEQRLELTQRTLADPPPHAVGAFKYSNRNYILAGAILEQHTGQSWEELVNVSRIGEAMGLDAIGFGPPQGAQPQGHRKQWMWTRPAGQDWSKADNPEALGPAGTMHATLPGWANLASAMLSPDIVITPETYETVTSVGAGETYALGWSVSERENYGRVIAHSGSNTMWLSQILILEDHGIAVLFATNLFTQDSNTQGRALIYDVIDRALAGEFTP